MMKIAIASLLAGSAAAFAPAQQQGMAKTSLEAMPDRMWNKMVDKTERSKSMPFLPRPINLDGSYVGDVGFDPFYLSSIPKNFETKEDAQTFLNSSIGAKFKVEDLQKKPAKK